MGTMHCSALDTLESVVAPTFAAVAAHERSTVSSTGNAASDVRLRGVGFTTGSCVAQQCQMTISTAGQKGVDPIARIARWQLRETMPRSIQQTLHRLCRRCKVWSAPGGSGTQHAREPRSAEWFDPADSQGCRRIGQRRSGQAEAIQGPRDTGGASRRGIGPRRLQLPEGRLRGVASTAARATLCHRSGSSPQARLGQPIGAQLRQAGPSCRLARMLARRPGPSPNSPWQIAL